MKENFEKLLIASKIKAISAINLVEASVSYLKPYDLLVKYTPKELEPYDALSDRFIRAIETSIRFFKTYEYYLYAVKSDTYRDLLLNMEKLNLISSVEIWIDMRDVRNRVVHDYLPHQIKDIFDLIMGEFKEEILSLNEKIKIIQLHK